MIEEYVLRPIEEADSKALKKIIQKALKDVGLDVPGTAYFDESLDYLHEYYAEAGRSYLVLEAEFEGKAKVMGGAGFAEVAGEDEICELQKLYLKDEARGQGLSKELLEAVFLLAKMQGYTKVYLETSSKLEPALGLYRSLGFEELEAPLGETGHSTMDHFMLKEL